MESLKPLKQVFLELLAKEYLGGEGGRGRGSNLKNTQNLKT